MKSLLVSAFVAAVLSGVWAEGNAASSPDEIAQIREQLQGLMQRVDKLEQENSALKAENESFKAQDDYLKAETRGLRKESATHAMEVAKVKGADWAGRVALKGDLRYRHEQISDETLNAAGVQSAADRYRDRVRARFNAEMKATDNILVGIGFATTEGGDPRSSNQSLTGVFSRKSVDLDTAYFDWKFASWGNLIGGKMKQPFVKPGQSLFWDGDVNPEGLAATFNRGMFFGSAYSYWINEASGAESTVTSDTMLFGGQIGARLPIGNSNLMLAAHYYDLSAGQGRAPFHAGNANGNTTFNVGTPPVALLLNDYQVVNLMAEFNTTLGAWPLQLLADVAQNQDPDDLDTAWGAGVLFGKAGNFKTWEFGAAYQRIEKDALFAQLIDSDFGGGVSDAEGWVLRTAYAPVKNWTLNATYFINQRNVDAPNSVGATEVDYDRLQLDFNVKF
ncbi:MAG: putative porin [Steroidobacter sp.]